MISIFRANTVNLDLNATTDDEPADLSGYTILFTVKPEKRDETIDDDIAIIKKEFVLSDTPNAFPQATLFLTETDTNHPAGKYRFDTKYFIDEKIVNSTSDVFEILQPVTNRDIDVES